MSEIVVIGAGHNGLIAALNLAKAGHSVTALERSAEVGGICRDIEFADGYACPGLLHDNWLDPRFVGLDVPTTPTTTHIHDGEGFREAETPTKLVDFAKRITPFALRLLRSPPPALLPDTTSDFWTLGKAGVGLRRLGREDMIELMRVPPMCAADWVQEHLDSPADAEYWASRGATGGFTGPWSAGTAANVLLSSVMQMPRLTRGFGDLSRQLGKACKDAGVTVHTNTSVTAVSVVDGAAKGVVTSDKEYSGTVLAACSPSAAFLDLVPPANLSAGVEQQFLNCRTRGTTAKWMVGLKEPVKLDADRLFIGTGSTDGLERAFDAVKYGEFSVNPVLDVAVYGNVLSVLASYVPYELRDGWDDDTRAELRSVLLDTLLRALPELGDLIDADLLWTPKDIEREYALPGGSLQHVEHALDQMFFMRPTQSSAHYRTPIPGLYLGSGGCHPCGGVTGIPGTLAAKTIIEDLR